MTQIPADLEELAGFCGLLTSFQDVFKRQQEASVESLLATLHALGVEVNSHADVPRAFEAQKRARNRRGLQPVIVAWDGDPVDFELTLPSAAKAPTVHCRVTLEDESEQLTQQHDLGSVAGSPSPCGEFVTFRLPLPSRMGMGYHQLVVEHSGSRYQSMIISAPRNAYSHPQSPHGHWGCFLPLYALRSERNWGAGDFTDLSNLLQWTSDLGGDVVGTLPMLAAFLDDPCEPSPYAPASRMAWNEFYIDLSRVVELSQVPAASELMQSTDFIRQRTQLQRSELVEYRQLMALKRSVLELLADHFFANKPESRFSKFEEFLSAHPHMNDYARFRAACEQQGSPWQQWPERMRQGDLRVEDYDPSAEQYHLYVQWIADRELRSLADAAGGGLYLDLPLGVRADGYDVWECRESYAKGVSAGSPPDAMWTKGQDWAFPPLHPQAIREQGYAHVRDYLRHHLRLARMLRVDHVMQLHRLYWIPHDLPANQGVYVKYRADEFYAILSLESHRCRTELVGENLGTVPPEVNQAMDEHGFRRMYVVQYEVAEEDEARKGTPANSTGDAGSPRTETAGDSKGTDTPTANLRPVPSGAMASLNTHDMPTFAAWWNGEDIPSRQQLGLISEQQAEREREKLATMKVELTSWLREQGWLADPEAGDLQILQAILSFLAAGPAGVVLVNLEDLWLETKPQNIPGTGADLPNWKRKAKLSYEEFSQQRRVLQLMQEVARSREAGSHSARAAAQEVI